MKAKNPISLQDFCSRHPDYLHCKTDTQYTALANTIYDKLGEELTTYKNVQIRNICISLALYFEDIHSETHQFEVFTKLYQQMYGKYVPFHSTDSGSDVTSNVDAMCFVLWLCMVAEHPEGVTNPMNSGVRTLAIDLWNMWLKLRVTIEPNEDLADFLYCEETQTQALQVKRVLIWLHSKSYLGRWYSNTSAKNDDTGVSATFKSVANPDQLNYGIQSVAVFRDQSWPLSLPATRIYAEMIRCEMKDPDDELAALIEKMQGTSFGIFWIDSWDKKYVNLRDSRNEVRSVRLDSFDSTITKAFKRNTVVIGSFLLYDDEWYSCGLSTAVKITKEKFEAYQQKEQQEHHVMHDFAGQYDSFIKSHGGNRLYFFADGKSYLKFLHNELDLDNKQLISTTDIEHMKYIMLYFESNGHMTISDFGDCVKHPSNPNYSKAQAEIRGLSLALVRNTCTPGTLMYLIEHNLIPDVAFNDIRGKEQGRLLAQENIDFLARCFRRDITTTKVIRPRSSKAKPKPKAKRKTIEPEPDFIEMAHDSEHVSYEDFVSTIASEKYYRSSANKEYQVVRSNKKTTVLRDMSKRMDLDIPTPAIYRVYLELHPTEIQVKTVVPYVGRENAPAVSALLYNIVGRGSTFHSMRKLFQAMIDMAKHNPNI